MVRFKVGEFVILLIYLSYLCFLMEYIDKTTQILQFNFLWKNFLSYFNSWAVKSLSLWLLLDNDANSHMKKLLLLINYWHKWSVYVNCSRYFIEINLNRSVGLNRVLEWMQQYFRVNIFILTQPAFTCSKLTTETLEQGVKYVQS